MQGWFSASWSTVAAVIATTVTFYITMLIAIRLAGRRTLAQLSAFDIVITVALGSLLATAAVSSSTTYTQAVTALLTLLGLQVAVAALRQRSHRFRRLIDFEPVVVMRDGRIELSRAPRGPQMTSDELMGRLRQRGITSLNDVTLVVVESSGGISVLRDADRPVEAPLPGSASPYQSAEEEQQQP